MKRLQVAMITLGGAALFAAERLFPLRERRPLHHGLRLAANALLAASASVASAGLLRPALTMPARRRSDGHEALAQGASFRRDLAAFLLMDLGYYGWHRANHRLRFLWRFHNVHHIDPELDLSTGGRFHFAEIALSAVAGAAWVLVVGVRPKTAVVYQTCLAASVAFHHANLRLPYRLERALAHVIVTPRMHGIHHSRVRREADSNFGSVFSFWDRIFSTLRLNVPQHLIDIGVPAYGSDDALSWWRSLTLPFRRQRDYWHSPKEDPEIARPEGWAVRPVTQLAP